MLCLGDDGADKLVGCAVPQAVVLNLPGFDFIEPLLDDHDQRLWRARVHGVEIRGVSTARMGKAMKCFMIFLLGNKLAFKASCESC